MGRLRRLRRLHEACAAVGVDGRAEWPRDLADVDLGFVQPWASRGPAAA
ncbi:hypothetical protein [Streptomyces milbemycinicus]